MERSALPQVLMIENNPADVLLTKLAMKSAGIQAEFTVFETIEDGLHYLEDAILPTLVLLDLNLFGEGGVTFLKTIRQNPRFEKLTVSVLTTSASEKDREACMSLGASFFIVKAMMFEDFIKSLDVFKPLFALSNT